MSRKRDVKYLPHDFHLWMAVAATVTPFRGKGVLPLPVEEHAPAEFRSALPLRKAFLPHYQASLPTSDQFEKSVDPAIRRKLARGRIEIDSRIDLHGMTQAEAHSALYRFIHNRFGQGDRTILVITGKGIKADRDYITARTERGVLRTMLPIWLSEPSLSSMVSSWSTAARSHGGEGAWYVRLRRT